MNWRELFGDMAVQVGSILFLFGTVVGAIVLYGYLIRP